MFERRLCRRNPASGEASEGAVEAPSDDLGVLGYLAWRSLHSLLLLWLVTVVVFGLLHLTPGDPASLMLGEQATPEQIRDLRHALGLDEPLITQYAWFLGHAVRGDFGASIRA